MPIGRKTAQSAVEFGVVDLFAGPGGLAEGFSAVTDSKGRFPFKIALSVEKEQAVLAFGLVASSGKPTGNALTELTAA